MGISQEVASKSGGAQRRHSLLKVKGLGGVNNYLVALIHCIEDLSRVNESLHRIQDSIHV